MARTVVTCDNCGQHLSVPQKSGQVECPKCTNVIALRFEPRVVYTPPWLNKKLGFLLILFSIWVWNNVMWFRINIVDDSGLFEGLAQALCFAGVVLVAFVDLLRDRGRLFGEQVHLSKPTDARRYTPPGEGENKVFSAPPLGLQFVLALTVPLLMVPVALMIPQVLNLCIREWFTTCHEIGGGGMAVILFLPFGVSLATMSIGATSSKQHHHQIFVGARISAVLNFAFFLMMMFLILTVSPV